MRHKNRAFGSLPIKLHHYRSPLDANRCTFILNIEYLIGGRRLLRLQQADRYIPHWYSGGGLALQHSMMRMAMKHQVSPMAVDDLRQSPLKDRISVANNTGTATLTITTIGPQSAMALPWGNHEGGIRLAIGLMIPAILFSGAGMTKPKRGKRLTSCLIAILSGACLFSAACGSSSNANSTPPASGTPAGMYSVTVTGAGGGVTHTASVSFTVQ